MSQTDFLNLYICAHNNAIKLLEEAEILYEAEKFPRAYALAFTALEEIAKSQLAADVYTSYITEAEFWDCYRDHRRKISSMAWATDEAQHYLDEVDGDYIEVENPSFANRMDALYVKTNGATVVSPQDVINRDAARGIIHTTKVALQRIIDLHNLGHQIGTRVSWSKQAS